MQAGGAMSEVEHYADDLRRAWAGESWQGPAFAELLKGLTAQQAARKPLKNAHSIWELVGHVAVWHAIVRTRMDGKKAGAPPQARNFPRPAQADAGAWEKA